MTEERKYAILFAATLLSARRLPVAYRSVNADVSTSGQLSD